MQAILLESGGRTLRLDNHRVYRVGRSPDADLVVGGDTVSREHLEFRPGGAGWLLVDIGSRHGTWLDDRRVSEVPIDRPLQFYLGAQGAGTTLTVEPTGAPHGSGSAGPHPQAGQPASVPGAPQAPPAVEPAGPVSGGTPPPRAHGGGTSPPLGASGSPAAAAPPPSVPPIEGAFPVRGPSGPGVAGRPGPLDPSMAMTQAIEAGPPGQYGGPQTGPDVIVRLEGREQRFRHPTAVTIGRHPSNAVVTSNASVSRFHARVDPVPGGWAFSNASSAGSFMDTTPVERVLLEDNLTVRLGHPTAGLEVEIAPVLPREVVQRRAAAKKRARSLRAVGLSLVGLLVVIGLVIGGVLLVGDDGGDEADPPVDTGLTSAELDEAKVAAVWIGAESTSVTGEQVAWSGSGSVIGSDGTILTNAHVAEPQAAGLAEIYGESGLNNPEYLLVAVLDSADDTAAEPTYRARVLASDGRLDASVIQIYADVNGEEIDPATLDLPTVPIGDSDMLRTGDHITVLGFPGISESPSVTVTSGLVSSFIPDEMFDSERAEIDTDARIAPGNSGGMAINDAGELVGIPSSLFAPEDSAGVVSGRIRAINLVKPLIDEAG